MGRYSMLYDELVKLKTEALDHDASYPTILNGYAPVTVQPRRSQFEDGAVQDMREQPHQDSRCEERPQ